MTDRPDNRSKTKKPDAAKARKKPAGRPVSRGPVSRGPAARGPAAKAEEKPKKRSVRDIILELAAAAGDSSISPGDVAKVFAAERRKPGAPAVSAHKWSRIVREEAIGLARAGEVVILRKGEPVDPKVPVTGVIRIKKAG